MPEDGGLINQALIGLKPVNACGHTYTKPQTPSTRSRGLGWRIHESVEDTKLSTNKQQSLSLSPLTGGSFAPVTAMGIGCGMRLSSALQTPSNEADGRREWLRSAQHKVIPSLHGCVALFYARPLRPTRKSVPRGSAPAARLPAAPPSALSRPCLPTGPPSLPSTAASYDPHVRRLCPAPRAPDRGLAF